MGTQLDRVTIDWTIADSAHIEGTLNNIQALKKSHGVEHMEVILRILPPGNIAGQSTLGEILAVVTEIKGDVKNMAAAISAFKAAVDQAFAQVNSNLDNIQADEASLAQKITDLQTEIANGNSTLTPEAQKMLDDTVATATAMANRTKTIADSVPDTVGQPVP